MLVILDNYDSFTYNLVHFLGELGAETDVVRNDQISVADLLSGAPDGIVISPGPCTPDKAGISLELVKAAAENDIPLLGVCLGHQSIGEAFGGNIVKAPHIMHGKTDQITHRNAGIFNGLPSPFTATRYHSLIIEPESLPDAFEVTAETEDGIIMGIRHRDKPMHGVQFHPESIATEHGHAILDNFLALTRTTPSKSKAA